MTHVLREGGAKQEVVTPVARHKVRGSHCQGGACSSGCLRRSPSIAAFAAAGRNPEALGGTLDERPGKDDDDALSPAKSAAAKALWQSDAYRSSSIHRTGRA